MLMIPGDEAKNLDEISDEELYESSDKAEETYEKTAKLAAAAVKHFSSYPKVMEDICYMLEIMDEEFKFDDMSKKVNELMDDIIDYTKPAPKLVRFFTPFKTKSNAILKKNAEEYKECLKEVSE